MLPYQNLSLEDMPGEVWKDIPGWEGYYQASTLGRIKSLSRQVGCRCKNTKVLRERIMSQKIPKNPKRYITISLSKDGTVTRIMVHMAIAKTFLIKSPSRSYIDHIDTDRHNNAVINLRWVTAQENANNPLTLAHMAQSSPRKKCIICKRIDGTEVVYESIRDACRDGFTKRCIQFCLNGRCKTHKGSSFRYAD